MSCTPLYFLRGDMELDQGYTKIINKVVDQFCHYRISGDEWLVLWTVIRKTYGWNKKQDKISLSQFAEITRLKRPNVARALKKLLEKGVIKKDTSYTTTYWFNKHYSTWVGGIKKDTRGINNDTRVVSKKIPKVVSKKIHTKDNKDTNTKDTSKSKYGEFGNVLLTLIEKEKLEGEYGVVGAQKWIRILDEGIELKGYKYKSHYLAILKWASKEQPKEKVDMGDLLDGLE